MSVSTDNVTKRIVITNGASAGVALAKGYAADAAAYAPYSSRAVAEAAEVPLPAQRISVLAAGEMLDFRRDESGTALTTADGASWSPLDTPSPLHWGAVIGDNDAAFQAMSTFVETQTERKVDLGKHLYTMTDEWAIPANTKIASQAIMDFSAVAVDLPNGADVYCYGGDPLSLPDLSASPAQGDRTVTFSAATDVQVGDVIVLQDPTNGSFHAERDYYKAGEMAEVVAVSGNVVSLSQGLYAGYDHTVIDMYRMRRDTMEIDGHLTIKGSAATYSCFRARNLVRPRFDNMTFLDAGGSSFLFENIYGGFGAGLNARQNNAFGLNTDYGGTFAHCQEGSYSGSFTGQRRGITTTGTGLLTLQIPCRGLNISGTFRSTSATDHACISLHGNAEYNHIEGIFHGGIAIGGDHTTVRGTIICDKTHPIAIAFSELVGTSHDFTGVKIVVPSGVNPDPQHLIELSNGANDLTGDTTRGGRLVFDNMEIDAPSSTKTMHLENRGYTGSDTIEVSLKGMLIKNGTPEITIDVFSGDNWAFVDMTGLRSVPLATISTTGVDLVRREDGSCTQYATISGGAIAVDRLATAVIVDTEGGAATDDLDTITGGYEGKIITLRAADASRDVTYVNNVAAVPNNIRTDTGADFVTGNNRQTLTVQFSNASSGTWIEISRSTGV